MTYKKNGETLEVSFSKEDTAELLAMISHAALPQRRVFNGLKEYINDNYEDAR